MRKNFLILMLLSLLPLAGWADDADVSSLWLVSIDDVTYGDAVKAPVVKNVSTGDAVAATNYDVEYYDSENVKKTVTAGTTKLDAGNYTVKVIGKAGFTGSITEPFEVKKANLTWTLTGSSYSDFTAVYKKEAIDKAVAAGKITISGQKNSENVADLFTVAEGAKWSYTGTNANWKGDGSAALTTGNNGYEVTVTGVTAKAGADKNYNISYLKNYVKIKQAVIDLTGSEFAADAGESYNATTGFTYTGNVQAPTYTITYTYGEGENDKETLQSSAFTVKYQDGDVTTEVQPWIVNEDFNAFVKTISNTNYTVNSDDSKNKLGTFKIVKSTTPLAIIAQGKSKKYDGTAFDLGDAVIIPGQLAAGDRGLTITGLTAQKTTSGPELAADAKEYKVEAKVGDDVKITKNGTEYKLTDLYTTVTPEATWEIEKADLTITATVNPITYGAALSTVTSEISVTGAISSETATIKGYYSAAINTGVSAYSSWTTETKPAQGTYENAFIPKKTDGETPKLANYNTPTLTPATLTVNGAKFVIMPSIASVEYGTAITPSYLAFDASTYATATVTGTAVYEYKVLGAADDTYTTTAPTAIGSYTVKVKEGLAGTGNYQDGEFESQEQDFNITKKTLNIKVGDVELWEGATWEILQTKGTVSEYTTAYDEELKFTYKFNSVTNLTVNTNAETGAQTTIHFEDGYSAQTNAITIELDAEDANTAHYKVVIDEEGGKLTKVDLTNPELVIDGAAASVTRIADAIAATKANTDTKYNVVLKTTRKLIGGSWNIMVLPFSVTPMEFITAIGNKYAVFNTLKSANVEKNTVSFSLNINEIPANTPFLVKPVEDVNYTTAGTPDTYLTFNSQKIEDVNLENGVPIYKGIDKVHFIGTYVDGTENAGGSNVLYGYADKAGKPTIGAATNNGEAASFTYRATSAILVLSDEFAANAEAPIILIEEADGSTTVIRNINAEGVAVPAEGWYNLNGVKLQGVPTEKGVYINNGKKVIIK